MMLWYLHVFQGEKCPKVAEASKPREPAAGASMAPAVASEASEAPRDTAAVLANPPETCMEGVSLECSGPRRLVQSNFSKAEPFDNEHCSGKWFALHRPEDPSGPYADYFRNRRRLWEVRVQLQFKRMPDRPPVFGIELEEYVRLSPWSRQVQSWVVKLLQRVVGNDLYHTNGDDPKTTRGPVESPAFIMPLWAFDQVIVSEPGEEPDITQSLDGMGVLRNAGRSAFMQRMAELKFEPGKLYTLNFWCISRFLDTVHWEMVGVAPGTKIGFNTFCTRPPVRVCIYELLDDPAMPREVRHLRSRKRYYWQVAFWSSANRPSRQRLEELLSDAPEERPEVPPAPASTSTPVARRAPQHWLVRLAVASRSICDPAAGNRR